MKNKLYFFIVVVLMLFISGCFENSMKKENPILTDLKEDIDISGKNINDSSIKLEEVKDEIEKEAEEIKDSADNAKEILPGDSKAQPLLNEIDKSANIILKETKKIGKVNEKLAETGIRLETAKRGAENYSEQAFQKEKEYEKVVKERDKLIEEQKQGLNKMLKWIIGGSLVLAGGIFAISLFMGNVKTGIVGGISCIAVLIIAITIQKYIVFVALAGLALILGALGFLVYQIYVNRKAIMETIWLNEISKTKIPKSAKEEIYGKKEEKSNGFAGDIQSSSTQKIIKNMKNKMPKAWKISKEDNT